MTDPNLLNKNLINKMSNYISRMSKNENKD